MVFWIVWLIIGIFFIVVFSVTMVPKIMLKTYAATLPVRVKTLERYSDRYGNVVVYSPAKQVRKYSPLHTPSTSSPFTARITPLSKF